MPLVIRRLCFAGLALWLLTACSSHILPCEPRGEEGCNGFDDDCDGRIDEGFDVGQPCDGDDADFCTNGTLTCTSNGSGVECANEDPADLVETCNDLDDDCDGDTDEGLPACACSNGGSPGQEICNAVDDDCDGQIDEDLPACACSNGGSPGQETCNAIDDDCDGAVDNGFPVGIACDSDDLDECQNGTTTCTSDGTDVECVNEDPVDIVEACNNLDDDCDGDTDEDLPACACSNGGSPGQEICNAVDDDCDGQIDEDLPACACSNGGSPGQETCNAIDDDCDGAVDNGFPVGIACDSDDLDECQNGTTTCTSDGTDVECVNEDPVDIVEACNNLDDDCDGDTDEDLPACACSNGGSPEQETCNAVDDDCDGEIDNLAACACSGGASPSREICDGIDNDCDEQIDEDNGSGGACHGFGDPCASSIDCVSQICAGDSFDKYCSEECDISQPSSCPGGYRCRQGSNRDYCSRDYSLCDSDADCAPDGVCTIQETDDQLSLRGECRPPLDGGVLPGEECPANRCRNDICHWTNELCSELCGEDADCAILYLDKPTVCVLAWLVVTPGDCGRDVQCPAGYQCVGSRCRGVIGCSNDSECAPHYACQPIDAGSPPTMACVPEPFYDYLGECRIGCTGDPDCPTGMQCHPAVDVEAQAVQGYCRNPSGDPTTQTGAGPCGGASDPPCSHGICYFVSGSSYCTQLCGDASECPGVMNCTPGTLNMGELGSFANTYTCTN